MLRSCVLVSLLLTCCPLLASELRWGFSPQDGMPYVAVRDQQLVGGFTHLLGTRVGQALATPVRFVQTPNNRLDEYLRNGRIQVICNTNPQWMSQANLLHWSAPLFQEEDGLLQHTQSPDITDISSLTGKKLGTSLGFVYSAELMSAFAKGEIQRMDVRDLQTRIQMLNRQRLDALIDMRRPLTYRLSRNPMLPVRFSSWTASRYWMHCAYGPHLTVPPQRLDQVLLAMRENGEIDALLSQAALQPP